MGTMSRSQGMSRGDNSYINHVLYPIPVLSHIVFIPSLYASFRSIFVYLSPLIFIYTQCVSFSGGKAPIKIPTVFSVNGDDAL